MNRHDQRRVLEELCNSLKEHLLDRIDDIPADWDGHEIRRWFGERAKSECDYARMGPARVRRYNNEVLVRNL